MKTVNKPAAINERQSKLHAYLWANRGRWVLSREIYAAVPGYSSEKTAYKEINADMRTLNMSGEFNQKTIGDRAKGYKLATREEFWDWSRRSRDEAIRRLAYLSAMNRDAKLDGQITLEGRVIRVFVEEASA